MQCFPKSGQKRILNLAYKNMKIFRISFYLMVNRIFLGIFRSAIDFPFFMVRKQKRLGNNDPMQHGIKAYKIAVGQTLNSCKKNVWGIQNKLTYFFKDFLKVNVGQDLATAWMNCWT